jgi:O-antigen/teichoic acid export membrane protein
MSVLRSLLTNTFVLIVGRLTAKVLTAVFVAFLARAVGPAGVGKYAFAGSLVAMFMLLPEFGFDILLVRNISKIGRQGQEFVSNIIAIKLFLAFVASSLMVSFAVLRQYDSQTVQIIFLILIAAILSSISQTICSIFRAFERMEFEALLLVVKNSLMVLFGVSAIKFGFTLVGIMLALVIADVLSFSFGLYIVNRKFVSFRPRITPSVIKGTFRAALPFGLLAIIEVVFSNTDILMISKLQGEMAVGWYSGL